MTIVNQLTSMVDQRRAKTVISSVANDNPNSGQKCILIINQAILIHGLENHLLYPMQRCLHGVHTSEVSKVSDGSPNETTDEIQANNPINAAHPLIIPLQ